MTSHKILKVKAAGFLLTCDFEDGAVVEYDMSPIKDETGAMVEPLKSEAFFGKVFLEGGALAWPNGYDVCPNAVYQAGRHVRPAKVS